LNILLECLARTIRQKGEIKGFQIEKEEVKLSLFADGMIFYLRYLKNSTKTFLDIINTFSKEAGYKNSIKKDQYISICQQ
jgi:hypothetical protein